MLFSTVDIRLDISFKKDDTEQVKQYTAGTVIRTTFDLIPTDYTTTTKVNKRYMVNGMISSDTKKFNSLSANQQIAIREQLSTSLTGSNTPCYWIKNGNTNTLFKEGENWVILDSGEYFIFSDTTKSSMTILGAGTKLIRGTGDTSNWSIPNRSSNIESINNLTTHSDSDMLMIGHDDYTFGPLQAKIIKELYKAASTNNPWVLGKNLLMDSGARTQHLKDLFRSHPILARIKYRSKGYYCLMIT